MLDHVFTDVISALRDAFERAFLERQAFEEHFEVDVLLGDLSWETSYGLPGEGLPPRVLAHITFDWPSWSQTAYRRWYVEDSSDASAGSPECEYAVECTYEGLYELSEQSLADGSSTTLDDHFGALGGWIAAMLVKLGDVKYSFLPAENEGA